MIIFTYRSRDIVLRYIPAFFYGIGRKPAAAVSCLCQEKQHSGTGTREAFRNGRKERRKAPQVTEMADIRDPKNWSIDKKYLLQGGGSIFTFEIKGTAETAKNFIDHLPIFSLLANVADVKSLVIHPASTTHSQLSEEELLDQGIKPNTIRLSVGIEKAEDLIAALETAFEAVR